MMFSGAGRRPARPSGPSVSVKPGVIEEKLGRQARKEFMDLQPGDVPATYANIDDLYEAVGFKPETPIEEGIGRFIDWYRQYYNIR